MPAQIIDRQAHIVAQCPAERVKAPRVVELKHRHTRFTVNADAYECAEIFASIAAATIERPRREKGTLNGCGRQLSQKILHGILRRHVGPGYDSHHSRRRAPKGTPHKGRAARQS